MELDSNFWQGRRVLVTGHTGFKGAWLLVMLRALGADVHGFALAPPMEPSLYALINGGAICTDHRGDIRDLAAVEAAMQAARPQIVIHMAAQSLVRASYDTPVETYAVNVMGTVNVMDACRRAPELAAAVMVTTDKCYENVGWIWGYRENDRLGGADPYSGSKAACELAVQTYRQSFFFGGSGAGLASARAGNVIGGGDFAVDRLIPDAMRAFMAGTELSIRNPHAVRPWQHVLEPLSGYLKLAQKLCHDPRVAGGWNFGPPIHDVASVGTVADRLVQNWGSGAAWSNDRAHHPHEAAMLKLDSTKALIDLGWASRYSLDEALRLTVDWYQAYHRGEAVAALTARQVADFLS